MAERCVAHLHTSNRFLLTVPDKPLFPGVAKSGLIKDRSTSEMGQTRKNSLCFYESEFASKADLGI